MDLFIFGILIFYKFISESCTTEVAAHKSSYRYLLGICPNVLELRVQVKRAQCRTVTPPGHPLHRGESCWAGRRSESVAAAVSAVLTRTQQGRTRSAPRCGTHTTSSLLLHQCFLMHIADCIIDCVLVFFSTLPSTVSQLSCSTASHTSSFTAASNTATTSTTSTHFTHSTHYNELQYKFGSSKLEFCK